MGENLPSAGGYCLCVDGYNDALAAKLIGRTGYDIGISHGGGVEADLVRPCEEQSAYILRTAHAAPYGQRNIAVFSSAPDHIEHCAAIFMRGVYVQKAKFICPRCIIGTRGVDWIACIPQIDKVYTFDHAAIGNIETGDDTGLEHFTAVTKISRRCLWANRFTCQRI